MFSYQLARGKKNRKREKYKTDATRPMVMNGYSTGMPPIQVRMATVAINVQKTSWEIGRKVMLCCLDMCRKGTSISTKIEAARAITPPSLLGTERKIA